MLNWLLDKVSPARAYGRLNPTLCVTLHGIRFTIRKMNPMDYMTGAKVLPQVHQTYEAAKASEKAEKAARRDFDAKDVERIKEHYRDTLMAGVVSVRCNGRELVPTRKPTGEAGPGEIPVAHLMTDWDLAEKLFSRIVAFTFDKKKLRADRLSRAGSS